MLSHKHARLPTYLCAACCIPIIFLFIYFLYPYRVTYPAPPTLSNEETDFADESDQIFETSTTPTLPTQTPISISPSSLIDLVKQKPSPTPTPPPEGSYPLPEPDNTPEFLSVALGDPESPPEDPEWKFNPERDAGDYGLSDWQCMAAFPQMYAELDRAISYSHANGNITIEDVDTSWKESGVVRAMIYDRVLYIIEAKYNPDGFDAIRALALLGSIHRAITAFNGPIPNIEFVFSVEDIANLEDPTRRPIWALARPSDKEEQWVMPDFGYWAWDTDLVGTYEQVRQGITEQEPHIFEKKRKAVWRGAGMVDFNPIRKDLLTITKDKSWADVREVFWGQDKDENNQFIPIADHCDYLFLIQTEGISYSGRLKYLLNCHSVSVIHRLEWTENYHHLLVAEGPNQNYVQVERNFSDLSEKIERLLEQPQEIERIANNSVATFRDRYLTPAAQACYWRRLFWSWRSVSFEPQLHNEVETINDEESNLTRTKVQWRGEPYQTYLMTTIRDMKSQAKPEEKPCSWISRLLRSCE